MNFELEHAQEERMQPLAVSHEVRPPAISLNELQEICIGDRMLEKLLKTMLRSCVDYTITVADFQRKLIESHGEATEEVQVLDSSRRSIHDRMIADVNIFSRALGKKKKDNTWMTTGGMDGTNRAAYMKFAISMSLSRI